MVDDPGFRAVIDKHIRQATALVAAAPGETGLLGGLLFSAKSPTYHVQWLVVSERARRQGVGRALMTEATRRFPPGPATVEVITFGTDHPRRRCERSARLLRAPGIHCSRGRPARPRRGAPARSIAKPLPDRGTSLELLSSGLLSRFALGPCQLAPMRPEIRPPAANRAWRAAELTVRSAYSGCGAHRCPEAILAPSAWDRNFAQVTLGTTVSIPAIVPNPQSVPAITLSRPTTSA